MFYAATIAQTPLVIMTEDHIGGYANDVTANQNNIFFCQAYSLKALTFNGTTFSTAGSLVLPWPGLIAYASNSELFIGSQTHIARIGISNLSNMTIPASNTIGTSGDEITSLYLSSDKLYVTMHNWNAKTGSFKILNKTNLSLLGSVDVVSQDVQVVGTTAYVITGHSTIGDLSQYLKIYNVANPSNITELGGIQLSSAENLYVNGNYVYIVGINRTGITIVDVSNPAAPAIIGTNLAVNGGIKRIKCENNALYAAGSFNIYMVDVTNPLDPVQKGSAEASAYITHITNFTTPTFNNFLLYTADGKLNSFNVTFPQNPIAGPLNESPSKTTTMTITGNNLFVGDLTSLWRYDLANSDAQTKYMTISNKLISSSGNNLYVVSDEPAYSELTVIDISNINSPQQKGTYQSNAIISKIAAKGNYVYLLQENSNIVEVINATNISAPAKVFTYQLTNTGTTLFAAKESSKNILYAGYYGNESSKGVELINVSNPAALTKLSTIATSGNPKGIHASENNLYVGSNTSNEQGWFLEAFNVTNTQSPVLSAQTSNTSAGEIIWDIFAMQNRLLVSFTLNGMKTYELVQSSGKVNQKSLIKTASALNNILSQTSSSSYTYYTHDIAAYQSDNNLYAYVTADTWAPQANFPWNGFKGMYKLKIPDFPPAVGDKVYLTMGVSPAEAVSKGCTTNPAPGGPYEYDYLATAQISAEEKPDLGWYFKDWTGASGGKSTSLFMDANKNVIANFVEVTLTVSGSAAAKAICPNKAIEQPADLLPITLCASPASGWSVHSITFQSSGTGNELEDIKALDLYEGSNLVARGTYITDNGECIISVYPPLIVPANQCITLNLFYVFDYDTTTYAKDTTYTFYTETKSVNATPQVYPEGLIQGKAKRDGNFIIARIYNTEGEGFSKINKALDYTQTGGTCYVCAGIYNENINISSGLSSRTLKSVEGRDRTKIQPADRDWFTIIFSDVNDITVDGFTIEGYSEKSISGIWINNSKVSLINNKILGFEQCIWGRNFKEGSIDNNIFDVVRMKESNFINLESVSNSYITNNTFMDNNPYNTMVIESSSNNNISRNKFINHLKALFKTGRYNNIQSNELINPTPWNGYKMEFKLLFTNNTIIGNKNIDFEEDDCFFNMFKKNELKSLTSTGSACTEIIDNTFKGAPLTSISICSPASIVNITGNTIKDCGGRAIWISEAKRLVTIQDNIIENNLLGGLLLEVCDDVTVKNNKISLNDYDGIKVIGGSKIDVYNNRIIGNKEHGIDIYGTEQLEISNNTISFHNTSRFENPSGLKMTLTNDSKVLNNFFYKNGSGIVTEDCVGIICKGNDIWESQSNNTGIHLTNSSGSVFGNNLMNNNGNGVAINNSPDVKINFNNLAGNSPFQLSNNDPANTVNASGNYWGSASGPAQSDIFGNVNYNDWLTSQVSLLCYSAKDTVNSAVGKIDSAIVYFQNFENPDDVLDITVSDELGWVASPLSFTKQMQDSLGTSAKVIFNVPVNANQGAINKVLVTGTSQSGASASVKDSFYICIYNPTLQTITVSPDSATAAPGDSVQFYISGSDQYGNTIAVSPTWQANLGEINTDGVFGSSTTGIAEITATDPISGIQAKTKILITDQEEQLTTIKISPSSSTVKAGESISLTAKGYNQFGFPYHTTIIWSCNKGYVDSYGMFTADSIEGVCTITAEDTTIGIKGTATVYVEAIVGVEEEKVVPTNYVLFQNYPNPFNPTTTLKYSLPATGMVTLEVFNILGEKVTRLVNEMKHAGYHEVKWNTAGFASGVYFYMIYVKAGEGNKDFRAVKKMILLK